MRATSRLVVGVGLGFLVVGFVAGQGPGGRIPGGGGGNDPLSLLRNASVIKELGITEEQTAKIPEALYKALAQVLEEKQVKRLRQIELQQRGNNALLDARVQKELGISDKQVANIKTIMEDSRKEIGELFKGGGGKGNQEKMAELRKETSEKIQGVLTASQRNAFKQLLGEEFKLERPTFGGGIFKGKRDAKKTPKKDVD